MEVEMIMESLRKRGFVFSYEDDEILFITDKAGMGLVIDKHEKSLSWSNRGELGLDEMSLIQKLIEALSKEV